jgi:hypothetical protein
LARQTNRRYRGSLWPLLPVIFIVLGLINVAAHLFHWNLEFVDVTTLTREGTEIPQGAANGAATSALDRGGARRVRGIRNFNRQIATFVANDLESRRRARRKVVNI